MPAIQRNRKEEREEKREGSLCRLGGVTAPWCKLLLNMGLEQEDVLLL